MLFFVKRWQIAFQIKLLLLPVIVYCSPIRVYSICQLGAVNNIKIIAFTEYIPTRHTDILFMLFKQYETIYTVVNGEEVSKIYIYKKYII